MHHRLLKWVYNSSNLREDTMKTIKWVATIVVFFAFVSLVPGQSSAQFQFTDVSKKDEHYEQVHYIAERGIINKVAKFNPNDNLTRAQAAKMLVIAAKKQNIPTPSTKFKDLKPGTEQYEYASRAVSLGYFKTKADGSFKPNEKLKREEMGNALAIAFNLSEKITADHPLMLSDMKGRATAERINGLYYAGITQGDGGKFLPNSHLTRKHFALFVARALNDKYRLPVKSPDQTSSTYFAKVNTGGDTLNVRSLPSVDGSIIARLKHGDIVEVIAQSGDWLLILLDDEEGYVNSRYTVEVGTEFPEPPVKPVEPSITSDLLGKVTVKSLNMREGPGTNSIVISSLTLGQTVSVLSLDGNWAKIHVNSQTGYVHKSYLKLLNQKAGPLKDRIIVIDAGHGGHDPGAVKNKVTEKSIALKVAKLVEAKLQKAGANVLMTRSNDTYPTLEQRTEYAKKHYAEAFVSIHVNAATASAKGAETYFDSSANANSAESKSLATYIQNNIVKRADMVDRRVKDERFYVIRNQNIAAVLVELGFITNSDDFKKLTSDAYLEIYAESIYQGLVEYYSAQ